MYFLASHTYTLHPALRFKIYWLVIGQDATGIQIRKLQSMLLKQVGGKNMKSSDVEETEEQEWLDMLVDAMTMRRALVVLDDPWLPEQVRYLNPVDGSRTDHRLVVTTRIRSLMPKAACIELALMDEEEAVVLLLDLANVEKNVYLKQASEWPPAAAYKIAAECGLLPMTLAIAGKVVRSWGAGWEQAVLPLLRQKAGTSTVEDRIIGAGLQSLKGEDAPAIKALFEMFAVTQEDFVHPMAVIELLWKSCCSDSAGKEETEGGHLMMCLNVRQWIQVLLDRSLLLGSLAKGVHLLA